MASQSESVKRTDYTIGWICAIEPEIHAAKAALDEEHTKLSSLPGDDNSYILGRIGPHNVVIAWLPGGVYGSNAAAVAATNMKRSFLGLQFGLMVGIGGGAPNWSPSAGAPPVDIRLGDVVVGVPQGTAPGVVQYDLGKSNEGDQWLARTGTLNKPPRLLLNAVQALKIQLASSPDSIANQLNLLGNGLSSTLEPKFSFQGSENDILFKSNYQHENDNATCAECDKSQLITRPPRPSNNPDIHYGVIGSANQVVKDSKTRDYWRDKEAVLCFEMEAAGLDDFQCLVIRGICDYADSHKNKQWQPYAALTASAYARDLLLEIPPVETERIPKSLEHNASQVFNGNVHWIGLRPSNTHFTGRQDVLSELEEAFKDEGGGVPPTEQKRFIITGFGGMGKSEICIKFAELHREEFWGVFWINAGDFETGGKNSGPIQNSVPSAAAAKDFLTIAKYCGIEPENFENVKTWLANTRHRWLLIIDNADNHQVDYSGYFPSGTRGNIILTSRNHECSRFKTAGHRSLERLDPKAAEDLLLRSSDIPEKIWDENRTAAAAIVDTVGSLTLALLQAGALIQQQIYTINEYPEQFSRKKDLILSDTKLTHSPYRSVYATFEVSASYLLSSTEQESTDSLDLLGMFAFFDFSSIPEVLISRASKFAAQLQSKEKSKMELVERVVPANLGGKPTKSWRQRIRRWASRRSSTAESHQTATEVDVGRLLGTLDASLEKELPNCIQAGEDKNFDNFRWRKACKVLSSLALVKIVSENNEYSISIHPLIHDWLLHRQDLEQRVCSWNTACAAISLSMEASLSWTPFTKELHPHILACLAQDIEKYFRPRRTDLHRVQKILYIFAGNLYILNDTANVERVVEIMYTNSEVLAPDIMDTYLEIDHLSALNYLKLQNFDEARIILQKVYRARCKLKVDDDRLLEVMELIGYVSRKSYRYQEALEIAEEVVKLRSSRPGFTQSDISSSLMDLARAHSALKQFEQARDILQRLLDGPFANYDQKHPDRLVCQQSLAIAFLMLEQYSEAKDMFKQMASQIEFAKDNFERNAQERAKLGMALACRHLKHYEEALEYLQQISNLYDVRDNVYEEGPALLSFELSLIYRHLNEPEKALGPLQKVLEIQSNYDFFERNAYIDILWALSWAYSQLGYDEQAAEVISTIMDVQNIQAASENPDQQQLENVLLEEFRNKISEQQSSATSTSKRK